MGALSNFRLKPLVLKCTNSLVQCLCICASKVGLFYYIHWKIWSRATKGELVRGLPPYQAEQASQLLWCMALVWERTLVTRGLLRHFSTTNHFGVYHLVGFTLHIVRGQNTNLWTYLSAQSQWVWHQSLTSLSLNLIYSEVYIYPSRKESKFQ